MSNEFKAPNGLDVSNQKVVNVADGASPGDAVNYGQLQNAIAGQAWKQAVRTATNTNGTLASAFANGSSVGGVTVATNDRILLMGQTSGAENGIYTVNASGAPTRATDADSPAEIKNATVVVSEGTYAGRSFTQTVDTAITLGTTALAFAETGGGVTYTADGNGIELSGTTFSLELNGATLSKSATGLKVADAFAGNGLQIASDVASVKLDTNPGLVVGAGGVKVDTSVVVRKYSADVPVTSAGSPATITHGLGNKDVMCAVYLKSTYEQVLIPAVLVDTNSLTLTFSAGATSGQYRVVVQG